MEFLIGIDIYQLLNRKSITVDDGDRDDAYNNRNGFKTSLKIRNDGGKKEQEGKEGGCCA